MTVAVHPAAKPLAIECRFAHYSKSAEDHTDLHFVKEVQHIQNEDGTTTLVPKTRLVYDWKRPFYVTKKGLQKHQMRKEWEDLENLNRFEATQNNLVFAAAKALGKPWFKGSLRDLHDSPYLYGTDITSTALLKQSYMDRWDVVTPYSNAVFDTETDVIHGTNEIIMATISFKSKVFTAVKKDFVASQADALNRIYKLADKHLSEYLQKRKIKLEVLLVDTEIQIIQETMKQAHAWQPDFLSVWNLPFDMDKILEACERAKIDPADLLNDPAVPKAFRHFKFKKGAAKKTTASGKVMNYKPAARWHTVFSPASFYWIDAMSAYRQIRAGSPEEPSYSLDAILTKHLKLTKLKFQEAEAYTGLAWHQFMQQHYPLEYVVYNQFDCISMEMLDEKTLDLQLSLPMFAGCSDFQHFNSQPRRTADKLHAFCLKHGKVIGCTSGEMTEENDAETIGLSGHIVALPAELVADNGLKLIEEHPNLRTNLRAHVADRR